MCHSERTKMIRHFSLAGLVVATSVGFAVAQEQGAAGEAGADAAAATAEQLPEPEDGAAQQTDDLETLVAHSASAQQFGNLATTKATSGLVGDLGDVMVLLHSQILDRLQAEEGAAPGETAMPEGAQERLDELSRLNDREFALGFAEWIVDAYPETIEAWRQAGENHGLQALSEAVVEQFEAQRSVAEKIIAADGDLDEVDDQVRQTLSWGGAMDQGNVAEQPDDQSTGITTELPSEHEPGVEDGEPGEGSLQSDP
jgi:Domain of unknown function (DUF4142)